MNRLHLALAGLVLLLPAAVSAAPVYSVQYGYQLFPLGNPAVESDSVTFLNSLTSINETFTATDDGVTNTGTVRVNLADGSVRLYAEASGGGLADGLAQVAGGWSDTVVFDLNGLASATIPFSITVEGTTGGNLGGATQGSVQAQLGNGFAGTGATSLASLFGSTYTGTALVFDGAETNVSVFFTLLVQPLGAGAVFADALNSAVFSWDLPEGVTYTSASGVFLLGDGPASVPEPSALVLLGGALLLAACARRRRAAPVGRPGNRAGRGSRSLCILAMTFAPIAGHAGTITLLDNLASPNGSTNNITSSFGNDINVTSTIDADLESVTVLLSSVGGAVQPVAAIYADNGGVPGSTLLALLTPSVSSLNSNTFQEVTFSGDFTFQAGVTVWISFYLGSGSVGFGSLATSSSPFAGLASSDTLAVVSPQSRAIFNSLATPSADGLALRLVGAVVPEPGALVLFGLGLLGIGVARRRKPN